MKEIEEYIFKTGNVNKIADILLKYDFKLSNTNMKKDNTNSVYNEFRNKTLDEIIHDYANQRNCIKEIMKVLYNVQEIDR